MNKVISTKSRVFMSIVGPSGCGKSELITQFIENDIFQPKFDKIIFFYQFDQQDYFNRFEKTALEKNTSVVFKMGVDFEFIEELPLDGSKYLLIFDDSCEEICRSKQFERLATAGRHRNFNVIYIKHNLFHKSPLGRDIELQNTHIILFKSPRDVQQVRVLSRQLGLSNDLERWYKKATTKPYGHLMIDLSPRTVESLRYSCGLNPTIFFQSSKTNYIPIDDTGTKLLYAQSVDSFLTEAERANTSPWS